MSMSHGEKESRDAVVGVVAGWGGKGGGPMAVAYGAEDLMLT